MRFVAHGMVLNERTYCEASIRSVYDFVEEIVIVEGANQYAYWANPYGLSSDNTAEIIRGIPDPEKKIRFYQCGWMPSKRELRNAALKMLTFKENTCILVLDLDEVWDAEDLKLADDLFSHDHDLHYIHHDLIQLRGDFEHYRDMSTGEQEHQLYNEQSKKQPIICRDDTELRQGRTAERLFRWTPGMHYVSHTCICDMQGRYPYIDPLYKPRRIWTDKIKFWHYNYLKPFPDVFSKFCYFAQQDAGKKRNDPEMVNRALSEGYIHYLFTGKHPAGSWAVASLPSYLHHPAIMESHPYRHKSQIDIVDPDREWIRSEGPDIDKVMAMLEDASRYTMPAEIFNLVPPQGA